MNEAETELEYIDPALKTSGWGVMAESRIHKQFPISQGRLIGQGKRARPLKADYVLEYKNRRLAVIGAKADTLYYTEGVALVTKTSSGTGSNLDSDFLTEFFKK